MIQNIKTSVKKPTFYEGVGVAVMASVVGSAGLLVLTPLLGSGMAAYLLLGILSFAYLSYLLTRSRQSVGRVTAMMLWLAVTAMAWFSGLPLALFALVQLGYVWLIRSLYFYASVLPALLDLGLTALSLIIAIWAWSHSGSDFLGIWTFFLLQALFVAIPPQIRSANTKDQQAVDNHSFLRAYRSAEAAVRKLSDIR